MPPMTNAEKMRVKNDRIRKRDQIRMTAIAYIAANCTGEAQKVALKAIDDEKAVAGKPGRPWPSKNAAGAIGGDAR